MAWRGNEPMKRAARALLGEPSSEIVASVLVRLETQPKAVFRRNIEEIAFYGIVYESIGEWVALDDALVEEAIVLGERYDVANIDALHAAAAIRAQADRFVTTEKPGKPLHRLTEVEVVHLLDPRL